MIQDLGKRMEAKIEKMQEMFNKDLEELKNKQREMNNTMKNNRVTSVQWWKLRKDCKKLGRYG